MKKFTLVFCIVCFLVSLSMAKALPPVGTIPADSTGMACTNPVELNSVTVLNTQCGGQTGGIILDVQGNNLSYQFNWTPNISNSNVAFNLTAGTYSVQIVRNNQPECTLDTTIIVNNSNGPDYQIVEILGANCLAANGKVTISPGTLQYAWSNGTTGAVNASLLAGCYYVTATEPSTNCYSVFRVCVPRINQLDVNFTILKQAKCNRPTGQVQLTVAGGSGNYSYSLGNGPLLTGLAAGTYTSIVQDNTSACADTISFVIQQTAVTGSVALTIYDVQCPGNDDGYLLFNVTPGPNFSLPFSFTLRDNNGNTANPNFPGSLSPGLYTLSIVDADSCVLPTSTFFINEPPPYVLQKSTAPQTCIKGGQILLNPSGSNGGFRADWADLPGTDEGLNRLNLRAGRYSATIYDSLFCQYTLDTVLIARQCATPDTLYRVATVGTTSTFCLDLPVGVAAGSATFSLIGGGISGSSAYGNWVLQPTGCLVYTAKNLPGYAVDTICIAQNVNVAGLSQQYCIIVSVSASVPTTQQIFLSVLPNETALACGIVPADIPMPTIHLLNTAGLNGTSGSYGTYAIDSASACITFQALDQSGYNVDDIGVAVCGGSPFHCTIIHYLPSVLPASACVDAIQLPASLQLDTDDCAAGATVCLPILFSQLNNLIIVDNQLPYQGGFQACDYDTLTAYSILQIPATGPYVLNQWLVNGQPQSGSFADLNALLTLLNVLDPGGDWHVFNNIYIVGGSLGNAYGAIKITAAAGTMGTLNPSIQYEPKGTTLRFAVGSHLLVIRSVLSGCADSLAVQVTCSGCPPLHNYTPDVLGDIHWNIVGCGNDTTFCTNLPGAQIGDYEILDRGQPFTGGFTFCGNTVGLTLDTGIYQLTVRQLTGSCEYALNVYLTCSADPADTLLARPDNAATTKIAPVQIAILSNDIYRGPVQVELLNNAAFGTFSYEPILGILTYTPNPDSCGLAIVRYRLTDTLGRQSIGVVTVNVACDKVIVFTGLSPNGDNLNDFWHIAGIDQFPKNEVQVFNRWGSRVLLQKGYTNQTAWAGEWNGRTLPDGTYFYMINLGDGSPLLNGYLELLR